MAKQRSAILRDLVERAELASLTWAKHLAKAQSGVTTSRKQDACDRAYEKMQNAFSDLMDFADEEERHGR